MTRHLMPSIRLSVIVQSLKIITDWTLALCQTQLPLRFSFHSINPLSPQSIGSQPVGHTHPQHVFLMVSGTKTHSGANLQLWSSNTSNVMVGVPTTQWTILKGRSIERLRGTAVECAIVTAHKRKWSLWLTPSASVNGSWGIFYTVWRCAAMIGLIKCWKANS